MDADRDEENIVIFGPGTYQVGPEGSIEIYGARHVLVKGCTMTPASEQDDKR